MFRMLTACFRSTLLCALACCAAFAVDGVLLIDQNRALAGNVTPGDAPGFPVSITQPGSYKLSGNLTVASTAVNAIEVRAEFVMIDLNGFAITGPGSGTGAGIIGAFPSESALFDNTTVMNGSVRKMGREGVHLATYGKVENVRVIQNGSFGVIVLARGILIGNHAALNGWIGLYAGDSSVVRSNVAIQNFGGITAVNSSVVGNAAAHNNSSDIFPSPSSTRDQNVPAP